MEAEEKPGGEQGEKDKRIEGEIEERKERREREQEGGEGER